MGPPPASPSLRGRPGHPARPRPHLAVGARVATPMARVDLVPAEAAQLDPAQERRISGERTLAAKDGAGPRRMAPDRAAGSRHGPYFMMAAAPRRAAAGPKRKRGRWETAFRAPRAARRDGPLPAPGPDGRGGLRLSGWSGRRAGIGRPRCRRAGSAPLGERLAGRSTPGAFRPTRDKRHGGPAAERGSLSVPSAPLPGGAGKREVWRRRRGWRRGARLPRRRERVRERRRQRAWPARRGRVAGAGGRRGAAPGGGLFGSPFRGGGAQRTAGAVVREGPRVGGGPGVPTTSPERSPSP